jgi:hypothetical protein
MTTFTGTGITVYRLAAGRRVMLLALSGVRLHNTTAWAKALRRDLGLSAHAPYRAIADAAARRLDELVPVSQREGGIQ